MTKCSLTAVAMLAVSSVAPKRLPSIIKPAYLAYDQTNYLAKANNVNKLTMQCKLSVTGSLLNSRSLAETIEITKSSPRL